MSVAQLISYVSFQLTAVADKVISTGDLETFAKATAKLTRFDLELELLEIADFTYRRMLVPRPSVYNTNLDALAEYSLFMKFADTRRIVGRVVTSSSLVNRLDTLNWGERDERIRPDTGDTSKVLQAVDVVGIRLNGRTRKHVTVKVLHNFDVVGKGNIATSFSRSLRGNVSTVKSLNEFTCAHRSVLNDEAFSDRDRGSIGFIGSLRCLASCKRLRASQGGKRKEAGDAEKLHLGGASQSPGSSVTTTSIIKLG